MREVIPLEERLKQQEQDNQKIELLEAAKSNQWDLFPLENTFYIDLLPKLTPDELKIILFKAAKENQWDIFVKLANHAYDFQLLASTFEKDDANLTLYDQIINSGEKEKLNPRILRTLYPLTNHNKPCILFFTTMMNGIGDLHNLVNVLSVFYQHRLSEQYEAVVCISAMEEKPKIIDDQLEQFGLNTASPNFFKGDKRFLRKLTLAQKNNIEITAQIAVSMCGTNILYDATCREEIGKNVFQVGFPEHGSISKNGKQSLIEAGYDEIKGMGFFQSPEYQEYGLFLEPCESTALDLFNYLGAHEPELTEFLLGEKTKSTNIKEETVTDFTSSHLTIPLYLNSPCLMLLNILSHIALDNVPFENICFITHKPVKNFIIENSKYDVTIYDAKRKETCFYPSNQHESNKKIKIISNLWLPRKQYEVLYKIAQIAFCKGPGTLELCIANQTLPVYFPVYPMQKKFLKDFHSYLIHQNYPQHFIAYIKNWKEYLTQYNYDICHENFSEISESLFTTFFPKEGDNDWLSTTCERLQAEKNFKNTVAEVLESILSPQVTNHLSSSSTSIFSQLSPRSLEKAKGKEEEILSLN